MSGRVLETSEAMSLLGEGVHTSFRKGGATRECDKIHAMITKLPHDDWRHVIEFLVSSLDVMGIKLVQFDAESEGVE